MLKKVKMLNVKIYKKVTSLILVVTMLITLLPSYALSVNAADKGLDLNWPDSSISLGYMCCGSVIDDQGNIYITDWSNNSIKKYTKDGVLDPTWPLQNTFIESSPVDICFDKDGNIITSGQDSGPVVRINTKTYEITNIIPSMRAIGFATDKEGNIYVNEYGVLHKYTNNGVELWSVKISCNMGACIDNQGNIYMIDETDRTVVKVLPSGVIDTTFGPDGTGYLTLILTSTGTKINSYIGLPTFYDNTLYVSCYGNNVVVKITGNGRNVEDVVKGVGPFSFIKYNDYYVMPSWSNSNISYIGAPNIDIESDNFEFSMNPSKVSVGSLTPIEFTINSTSTNNYTVKAQLIDKLTREIISDVNSTTAKLVDGDATVVLTPSAEGWVKGNYDIQLILSSTSGSITSFNTLDVGISMGVGYYAVNYNNPQNGVITNKTESVEIGTNGTATFTLTPDEGYFIDKNNTTVSNGTLSVDGNVCTIYDITGDVNVYAAFTDVSIPNPTDITGIPTNWVNGNQEITFNLDGDIASVTVAGSISGDKAVTNNNGTYSFFATQYESYKILITDNAGNQGEYDTQCMLIDNDNPNINIINGIPTDWTNESQTISFTATDYTSVIESVTIVGSISGNTTFDYNGTYSFTATQNETFTITITDLTGNITTLNIIVSKIDKTTPIISVETNGYNSEWTKDDVTFDFSNTETNISGVKYQYSTNNGTTWADISGTSLIISNDTNKVYIFRAISGADTISSISDNYSVKVQKIAPQFTDADVEITSLPEGKEWYKEIPSIELALPSVTDFAPLSVYYQLYTGSTPSDEVEFTGNNQPTITSDGEYTLNVWSLDDAGNKSEVVTKTIKVDTTAPTADIKVSDNSIKSLLNTITFGLFFKDTVDVTITTDTDESGIASVEYQKVASEDEYDENGTWTSETSLTVQANEKFIIYARITDNAGNVTIMNSNGVVVYTDSVISTTSSSFCKEEGRTGNADVNVQLVLNSNTLNEVVLGTTVLTKDTDYTLNGDIVTLKKEYLNSIESYPAEIKFSFNPLGETYLDENVNQETAVQTFTVNELVHVSIPTITTQPVARTYSKDDTAQALSVAASNADNGTLSYQWYAKEP